MRRVLTPFALYSIAVLLGSLLLLEFDLLLWSQILPGVWAPGVPAIASFVVPYIAASAWRGRALLKSRVSPFAVGITAWVASHFGVALYLWTLFLTSAGDSAPTVGGAVLALGLAGSATLMGGLPALPISILIAWGAKRLALLETTTVSAFTIEEKT